MVQQKSPKDLEVGGGVSYFAYFLHVVTPYIVAFCKRPVSRLGDETSWNWHVGSK